MIILKQDTKLDKQKLENLLNKYARMEYTFNVQLIQDDIDKIDSWIGEAHTALRLENLKKVKSYLTGLLKKAQAGTFNADWVLNGNKIASLPVEIRKIKMFNIQATDYMVTDQEAIVAVDYTEVINIITMDMAYKDFDFTAEYIEDKLLDIGLITIYDSALLKAIIDPKAYDRALVMRVGDTPYLAPNKKQVYTYFGESLNYDGTYRKVISETCDTAISIIAQNILTRINTLGYKVKICGVFEDSIYFMLPDGRDTNIEGELSTPIMVRAFGRKFEVKPKVQIY